MIDAARPNPKPQPLEPALLASLTLGDGRPLPPSLAAWLAYDGAWQPFEIDVAGERLVPARFTDLLAAALPEIAPAFAAIGESVLPGDCYRLWLPSECDEGTVLFLYAPVADGDGEPAAIGFCLGDDGFIGVFGAGFDVYLARVMQLCEAVPYAFGPGPAAYADAAESALAAVLAATPTKVRKELYDADGVLWCGGLTEMGALG
jgi:hypothetical protein